MEESVILIGSGVCVWRVGGGSWGRVGGGEQVAQPDSSSDGKVRK